MRRSFFDGLALLPCIALAACGSSSNNSSPTVDTGTRDANVADVQPDVADSAPPSEVSIPDATPEAPSSDALSDAGKVCAANQHPGDQCDLIEQNCPAADICEIGAAGYAECDPYTAGAGSKGDACSDTAPCDRGLFCIASACSPACCIGDDSNCGSDGTCSIAVTSNAADGGASDTSFYACAYASACHPFAYDCPDGQVCLFTAAPDVFTCSSPSDGPSAIGTAPGVACSFINDCGESQDCTVISTSGADAGSNATCYLFCLLAGTAETGSAASLDGRFAANGTCDVGGVSYGTCQPVDGIGGGLGICLK